jgi:pimeloyl-ACP methyl ester carboxylesterase
MSPMSRAFPAFLASLPLGLLLAGERAHPEDRLARAPSRWAKLDGIRVHYKSIGKGRSAVVFVHGWSGDHTLWRDQAAALDGKHRAVYIDLPGHGASDKPEDATYTMGFFARSVEAVLADAGVGRAVLVGHSNGTPVVRQFYRLYPDRTAGLVVVDGALRRFFDDRAQFDAWVARFGGADAREQASRYVDSITARSTSDVRERIRRVVLATPPHVMVRSLDATWDPTLWSEDPIRVPLLVVLARAPFWDAEYEAFVRRLAPDVAYRTVEGTSHFLMMDKPGEFNDLLLAFVDRTTGPR